MYDSSENDIDSMGFLEGMSEIFIITSLNDMMDKLNRYNTYYLTILYNYFSIQSFSWVCIYSSLIFCFVNLYNFEKNNGGACEILSMMIALKLYVGHFSHQVLNF